MWHKIKNLLFPEKQAMEETIEGLKRDLDKANREIDRKVLNLFCENGFYVNPRHVFDITPHSGIPYLGQEPITKEKARELKADAELVTHSLLYDILMETLRQKAIDMGLKNSTNWEQVLASKMMLHNLGLIKNIIEKLLSIDPDKIPEASGKNGSFVI